MVIHTHDMSDFLDHLPSPEREKIRKKMRSPEAYAALRERVKGPEDLEKEMKKSEQLAEVHLQMESEPRKKEEMKKMLEKDVSEQGIEKILETKNMSADARAQIEAGNFQISVSSHPQTHQDALIVAPEGNIQEKIPVKTGMSEHYVAQFLQGA